MITDIGRDVAQKIFHGSKSVGTTAEQIMSQSFPIQKGITIYADPNNAGTIYVGTENVTADTAPATDGFPLAADKGIFLSVEDTSIIHVIASQASQKLFWLAE